MADSFAPETSLADDQVLVELQGVTRRYATGTVALADIDLSLRRGESVAITGRSGSGKSTLLNILGLLDVPDAGKLIMDGHRVEGHSDQRRSEYRSSDLGFVFQRSHLISALSARENVLLGLRYANCPEVSAGNLAEEALRAVDLEAKTDAIARTLSGGEMQRVAIARALARPALLWLADEPTGNLDSAQSVEVVELLRLTAAERGACLVVVTHEPEIAARMSRVVTLCDGRIVADSGLNNSGLLYSVEQHAQVVPDCDFDQAYGRRSTSRWQRVKRTGRFIVQGVGAHPGRAWSGITAAAVAVALTLAAIGLAQSASAQVTGLFDAQRATQVTARLTSDPAELPRWPIRVSTVENYPGVTGVEYWRSRDSILMTNGSVAAETATVIEVEAEPGAASDSVITWSPNDDHDLGEDEVLLGAVLADRLGIGLPDLNPEVTVGGSRLRVVGVLTSSRSGTARGSAFVSSAAGVGLPDSLSANLYIETVPGAARQLADRLRDIADPYRTTQMNIDPVLAADSYLGQLEDSVQVSLQLLAVVAALAGLVAVVFVNILSVGARTAEFGVRRAFGARRSEIASLVVGESTLLGLLGAVLGLAVGFLTVMVVTALARWQPVFDLRLLLVPLLGALLFGTLGGLAPAVAAGRIQPADAVRS